MNQNAPSYTPVKVLRTLMTTVLLFLAGCFFNENTAHATISTNSSDLLQFTASGHILGFESEGMYVASGGHVLRVEFTGTDDVKPVTDQISAKKGHTQPLGRVDYPELWTGISLSYEAVSGGIVQSSYLLEPGADVSQIRLRYNALVEIEDGGNLRIDYERGWMNESAPVAWQEIEGRYIPVTVAFSLYDSSIKNSTLGFSLGQHNPAYPLIIDPTLSWNTFIGSIDDDRAQAITVDNSGNVYVAGYSCATWGLPVNVYTEGFGLDGFVTKLNSSGTMLWNTFIGGGAVVNAITADGSGNVYVAGQSLATWGSPVNAHAGSFQNDAFAAKLNSNGELQWNTFMATIYGDSAYAIALDSSGNVYVAGFSSTTWGSPVNAFTGTEGSLMHEAFAAKLNNSGELQWNTFMGSADDDRAQAIAVDGSGNVYVAGYSYATWGAPVNAFTEDDAFVAKLNNSGELQWNTFMGSEYIDSVNAIALDDSENVYVAGYSYATWGTPVNAHTDVYPSYGFTDGFAAKLNNSGELLWNTFMGGVNLDRTYAIAVDGSGNVYVAGQSLATWGSPVNAHAGTGFYDGFAAKLNNSGELQWNTFMGSESIDLVRASALDGSGNMYVAGSSDATWGSPVNAHTGESGYDVFVARLSASITKSIPWIPLLLLGD